MAGGQSYSRDDFRQDVWDKLAAGMRYCRFDPADSNGEDRLGRLLVDVDAERGTHGNRVYYLAVPPSAIAVIVSSIAKRRAGDGWVRLIVVRPRPRLGAGAERADR